MSLRIRLSLLVLVLVTVGVAAASWASFVVTRHELLGEIDTFLVQRASSIAEGQRGALPILVDQGDAATPPNVPPPGGFVESDSLFQVLDAEGNPVTAVTGQATLPVSAAERTVATTASTGEEARVRVVVVDGDRYQMITYPVSGGGAVQVARSLVETEDVLASLRLRLALIGSGVVTVAALTALFLARRATRPIAALTAAAAHVAATEDLSAPIVVRRRDEVGALADSFNAMLSSLATSKAQQRRLVQDASHELRTPLTSLRTNIEVLERAYDLDPDERRQILADIDLELNELTNLANELVELATEGRADEPVQTVELGVLAENVAQRFERRTGRTVEVRATQAATIDAHPAMVERAMSNLVDNALKFSPPATPVEVEVQGTSVRVRDHGPGIELAHRDRVFDRFYRATADRSLPGSGLGLAIVRQAVEAEHGVLVVEDAPGGGAVVGFDLPDPAPDDRDRSSSV